MTSVEHTTAYDPDRVTAIEVPARDPDMDITAGWDGNPEAQSYYFVCRWKDSVATSSVADLVQPGDIDLAVGPPYDEIGDISTLAAWLTSQAEFTSHYLVAVFYELLCDRELDYCTESMLLEPYEHDLVARLVGNVMDRRFVPILGPEEYPPPHLNTPNNKTSRVLEAGWDNRTGWDPSRIDQSRITRHKVPSKNSELELVAGWNGNNGDYFFTATWLTNQPAIGKRAGDLEIVRAAPSEALPSLSNLAAWMTHYVDFRSPDLVGVFTKLFEDRERDYCAQAMKRSPGGNPHLPALIDKVLNHDFTPVVEPTSEPAEPPASKRRGVFDPRQYHEGSSLPSQ